MLPTINKLLRGVRRRIHLMVTRGVIRLVNDATNLQQLQLTALADEVLDGVERMQNYGFTAHPHIGADALMLCIGGQRSQAVVIAVDDRRHRFQLEAGEVAMYDDLGQSVVLSRGGIVIHAPLGLTINGDVDIPQRLTVAGVVVNTHQHTGDSGGTTGVMR